MWQQQTLRAAANCKLLVVTKMDGSLGKSQEGEVRWLKAEGKAFEEVTIKEFAEMLIPPVKAQEAMDTLFKRFNIRL